MPFQKYPTKSKYSAHITPDGGAVASVWAVPGRAG